MMGSAYYPAGSMAGSGIDDYELDLEVECLNDECEFEGTMIAVVRNYTAYTDCPVCGFPIEREVEG